MEESPNTTMITSTLEFLRVGGICYGAMLTLLARMSLDQRWLHGAPEEDWLA
jgi:hypothetical protein